MNNDLSPADTIRSAADHMRADATRHLPGSREELFQIAVADWLDAELLVHQQAGALAASAASGDIHIGGELVRVEVGLSTFDKALGEAEHG